MWTVKIKGARENQWIQKENQPCFTAAEVQIPEGDAINDVAATLGIEGNNVDRIWCQAYDSSSEKSVPMEP